MRDFDLKARKLGKLIQEAKAKKQITGSQYKELRDDFKFMTEPDEIKIIRRKMRRMKRRK